MSLVLTVVGALVLLAAYRLIKGRRMRVYAVSYGPPPARAEREEPAAPTR